VVADDDVFHVFERVEVREDDDLIALFERGVLVGEADGFAGLAEPERR